MDKQDNNNYIWLYHNDNTVKTLSDFIERAYIYGISPQDLFDYNRDLIFQQMSPQEKTEYMKSLRKKGKLTAADLKVDMTLPCPCNLKINASNVTAEIAINQTNLQINIDDYYAFADEQIQNILQDEGYRADNLTKRSIDCKVFGWFKSMYYVGQVQSGEVVRQDNTSFIDLSRHIMSLSTLSDKNGGSFTLRLPIINAKGYMSIIQKRSNNDKDWAQKGQSEKNKANLYEYGNNEYFSKTAFADVESNYFNWLISSNDLLFISFEKLEMEPERDDTIDDKDTWGINTAISGNVYDMIGLVDDVAMVTDANSGNSYVEVTGRDLMKLFIEDGSFFFNPSTTSDPSTVFINEHSTGKQGDIREADQVKNTYNNPINRLRRITGEIDVFANRINMDIGYILKGVISQLANIEVVPDYVFDSWGDARTKFIELYPQKEGEKK